MHHNHIVQLRTKLEEAYNGLHLSIGTYTHSGPNTGDTIYAVDFQELRTKIKDAWTALSSSWVTTQAYDGNGLRLKKNEYGTITYYLRSAVLRGQVVAELSGSGDWQRGYVYSGSSLLAVQQSGVFWMHEDPVTKSKRVTDVNGNVVSAIELDPWGADTNASWAQAFQPKKYTSYSRDANGGDEAMFRRYDRKDSRFNQPDPYEGSYTLSDPQSFNRYAYVQNDPVNQVDPSGLMPNLCFDDQNVPTKCPDNGPGGSWIVNVYVSWSDKITDSYGADRGLNQSITMRPFLGPQNPQITVTAKDRTISYADVLDLIRANNQSSASNGDVLCQAYKESRAQGQSFGTGRNRRWSAPPLGTFNIASQPANSVSHRGLMQVDPIAAQLGGLGNGKGQHLTDAQLQSVNPDYINNIWDPAVNIRTGTGYMQYLMDHYNTDVEGALERFRGYPGSPTARAYARNILDCAARVDAGDTLGGLQLIR